MGTFRVATYNVNSIRSRLHIIIPWLKEHRPDVLCMQETKVADDRFPLGSSRRRATTRSFAGHGSTTAWRSPRGKNRRRFNTDFPTDGPADEDRLIAATFKGIPIVNTYVPQGRERETAQFAYKLAWFERLKNFFASRYPPETPLIWCGDLNVAPEAIDVHDPKRLLGHVCFTPEVWEAFAAVRSWGFTDIFRKHHPGEAGRYTFFDYRVPKAVERGLGWRVDHILATEPLAARSLGCDIDMKPRLAEKPSDHTILVADFATGEG